MENFNNIINKKESVDDVNNIIEYSEKGVTNDSNIETTEETDHDQNVIECKNEADHIWEEETGITCYDNSEVNNISEVDDKRIDYNINEESSLKEPVENFNNIRIKKESVEDVKNIENSEESVNIENNIETTENTGKLKEMESIDDENVLECKNEADHIWKEETGITCYDNSEVNNISEVTDKPADYNINEAAILEGIVGNVNNFEISLLENVKNDNYTEIMDKNVKNLSDIEIFYILPGGYVDELHSEIPEGRTSQEALGDHKKWSAERAHERTVKIIPRLAQPVVVSGVQFAKSPRVELWKYNAPPEYAGLFGAPFKRPKAYSLKQKNNSKASNEESVKTVNADANISGLIKKTKHSEEAKDVAYYTETVVGDKTNSLVETCKNKFICDECGQQFHKKDYIILHMKIKHVKDIYIGFQKYAYSSVNEDRLKKHSKLNCEKRQYFSYECNNRFVSKNVLKRHKQRCGIKNNVSNTHSALEPYSCPKCCLKFTRKHDFKRHTGEKPYSCTVCSKRFSESGNLKQHMRIHTGEKPYLCTVCNKQFSRSSHLDEHMRTHTGEKPYVCTVCNKQFSRSSDLKYHMGTHTGEKPYSCTVCKKQFIQSCNLNYHMRKHTGEKPYVCTVCNKQFTRSSDLKYHMRTHTGEKPYVCTVCNKNFSRSSDLNRHMGTHTGEKPYSCMICSKRFSLSCNLDTHTRTHTGEKPYVCTVCNKQFSRSTDLSRHMGTHTGEKPYSCTVCNKQFIRSTDLNRHIRTHTGEKPYSCTVCQKQFIQSSNLNNHMRKHTGEKPYVCTVCNKQFTRNSDLKYHMRTHTGEKPHVCTVCNKHFSLSGNLNKHMRTHIGEKPTMKVSLQKVIL